MNCNVNTTNKIGLLTVVYLVLCMQPIYGQESNPDLNSNSPYHNQLFFNRFLINPTFSLVRENKSYIDILHRNQYATFEDNRQNYFLGFSNKLNETTALGISVHSQWSGVVQEFGFNANYAKSVKLGVNSQLTFGANVAYSNEGIDKNRAVTNEYDPKVMEAGKESKIAIQPGIVLSLGKFDIGLYAENLFKYNQTANNFLTNFNDKSIKASLQYTHTFNTNRGLFANARIMPLLQLGKNTDGSLEYMGSLLLDLPKYGWLQTNFDDNYGLSLGLGFNLSKTMSLGYLLEKNILKENADLGWNHEISLAYTFKNDNSIIKAYTENSQDAKIDNIIRNYEEQILRLTAEKNEALGKNKEKSKVRNKDRSEDKTKIKKGTIYEKDANSLAYQNRLILDELILRQDSIEAARTAASEKRFELMVRVLRKDIKQNIKAYLQDTYNEKQEEALAVNSIKSEISKSVHPVVAKTATESQTSKNAVPLVVSSDAKPVTLKSTNSIEHKDYVKLPIKVLGQSDFVGVKSGYYVIVNVYKTQKYLKAFMDTLNEQGLNAKQFYNKENGLYYVYLADFNFKEEAQTAYVSNLNGKYSAEKWIMQVDNSSAVVNNVYED